MNNTSVADYVDQEFPFLDGLKQLGMYAQLIGDRIHIGPRDLITDKIVQVARENREQIIAELQRINISRAEDEAESFQVATLAGRYDDPNHNLEEAYYAWVVCYELAAELYNQLGQDDSKPCCWNGDPHNIPPAPFYWVLDSKLNNPAQRSASYKYFVMFRDGNNSDSVVADTSIADRLRAEGKLPFSVKHNRDNTANALNQPK